MKEKYLQLKNVVINNPRLFYKYVMGLLMISFVLIFVQHIYFTPEIPVNVPPEFYAESDAVKMDMKEKEAKIEKIVKEMQDLKSKHDATQLNTLDSLRIEYLFNNYQKLKNGL